MAKGDGLRVGGAAAIAFGVVVQFAAQPLLPFAEPIILFAGGLALALGLGAFPLWVEANDKFFYLLSMGCTAIGLALLGLCEAQAANRVTTARSHCLKLEAAMLLPPRHARADLPAVFTALGCKPQL